MPSRTRATILLAAALATAACSDNAVTTTPISAGQAKASLSAERGVNFSRYVAIGTSVSMGWTDDGVVGAGQSNAWPHILATAAGASFTTPRIAMPGCAPALMSPLASFRRIDGTSVAVPATSCSPLEPGITLPTNNLAIEGATAVAAMTETPEAPLPGRDRPAVVSRVLPPGQTQVSTMRAMNPTFVTVDFGGNEVLPAQVGVLVPGLTYTPYDTWRSAYAQVVENVAATGAKALLMALPHDLRQFPTIRTGPEIATQRPAFAAFNVSVSSDCDASPNFVFVRGKVLTAIATGAAMAHAGLGPYTLSCADVPGTADYILTPGDVNALNALLARMNAEIARQALARGFALSSLDLLYAPSKIGVPFNLVSYLTGPSPYGPLISLDGVHPNAAGQQLLANGAILAIDLRYGATVPPVLP